MKFSNVRLLVKDYKKCFEFYTEKLGFEAAFDMGVYASFKVAEGIEGLDIRVRRNGAACWQCRQNSTERIPRKINGVV
jgi:catechol 2,3-dioxygenase-like lactoylglutathione lyase family enzyme